jgi:DNA polymerase III delta subunit
MLVDRVGVDLGRIENELGKLALSVDEGEAIDVEHVRALAGRASEEKGWEIQSALLSGDPDAAMRKFHELIDLSGESEVLVTYAVADLLRKLHGGAAMAAEGARDGEICRRMKVFPEFRQPPYLRAMRKLTVDDAAELYRRAIEVDRRSKSGFGDGVRNVERICVQLADRLR